MRGLVLSIAVWIGVRREREWCGVIWRIGGSGETVERWYQECYQNTGSSSEHLQHSSDENTDLDNPDDCNGPKCPVCGGLIVDDMATREVSLARYVMEILALFVVKGIATKFIQMILVVNRNCCQGMRILEIRWIYSSTITRRNALKMVG